MTIETTAREHLARRVGLTSTLMLFSRLSGLIREQLTAGLLGAGFFGDAFQVAFKIPQLFFGLFGEGGLSAAMVPTLARRREQHGVGAADAVANRVLGTVLAAVVVLAVLGVAFAPQLIGILGAGFPASQAALATLLGRIMVPLAVCSSVAAVAMGILNAQTRFAAPAAVSSVFNLVVVAAGCAMLLGSASLATAALGLAIAVLFGGIAQVGLQSFALARVGFRFRPQVDFKLRDPGLREIAGLMTSAAGGIFATNANMVVATAFASHISGAATWMSCAFRLVHVPIDVFGVAIGTVSAPGLALHGTEENRRGLLRALAHAIRLLSVLTIPAIAGLIVLAGPATRVIYQHGQMDGDDASQITKAIWGYLPGVFALALTKVYGPVFFALNRGHVPAVACLLSMFANVALCGLLFPILGHLGLALAASAGAWVQLAFLVVTFQSTGDVLRGFGIVRVVLSAAGAAVPMGAVAWTTHQAMAHVLGLSIAAQAVSLVAAILTAAVLYAGLLTLLDVEELAVVRRIFTSGSRPGRTGSTA